MSFNTALSSGQYDSLRGTVSVSPSHRARLFLSLCPNTVVYSARVNQAIFAKSTPQFNYDGGSGTLADVRVGMTVLISHTNDQHGAFFVGRVRKTPTGTILYINETSAPLADNDYIFVLDDYAIRDKLPRAVANVEFPDYDVTFRQLLPRIWGLKSAYVAMVDTGDPGSFALDPSVAAATDGATISSYLWEVADGTITVGTDTDQDITVEFPAGFRWIHLTVTDSGGRSSTRHIPVWVHDDTYPPTLLDHGDLEVTASIEEGYRASVTAFAGISDILDNTLVCAWLDGERYNESLVTIVDNIAMLGRLRNEGSQTNYQDAQQNAETRFEIEGPLQQLARLEITSQQIDNKASPTKFNQVKTLTLWREILLILTEYSTFHELHSLSFDDTSDTYREKAIATQAGNILSVVNALANGINAGIQMNSAGEAEVVRNAVMIPTGDRSGLVTVGDWETVDILGLTYGHSHVRTVGRLDASGGSYKLSNGKVTVATSIAPGMAPDYPDANQRLDNQILSADLNLADAETELNERAGHAFAKSQETDELTIDHPDGYWWLTPSANQWYTFTLDGSETARGVEFDNTVRWLLVSTTITHEIATGTRTVQAVYRRETSGAPGQAIRIPPQNNAPLTLPDFPPLDGFPAFGDGGDFFLGDTVGPAPLAGSIAPNIRHDGNTVVAWTENGVWVANDFITQLTPTWVEITPPLNEGETVVACRFTSGNPPGILVMTNDSGAGTTTTYDFTLTSGGFVPDTDVNFSPTNLGVYVAASGWQTQPGIDNPNVRNVSTLDIRLSISPAIVVSAAEMTYNFTPGTFDAGGIFNAVRLLLGGSIVASAAADSSTDPSGTGKTLSIASGFFTVDEIYLTLRSRFNVGAGSNGLGVITQFELTGGPSSRVWHKTNAFEVGGEWSSGDYVDAICTQMRIGATFADVYLFDSDNCDVYYSDDYGATFAAAVNAGTPSASADGFDTGRLGLVTLAGTDTEVVIATTAGGAYSNYRATAVNTVATAIFIPRYKFSGANNGIGVSAPDFIYASAEPEGLTLNGLFKVTSGGATIADITPEDSGADKGLAVSPNCLAVPWYSTAYQDLLAVLSFAGARKLAVSIDGGASWEISGALHSSAAFITTRRSDTRRKQLWINNGPNIAYCSDYKVSPLLISTRIGPSGDTVLGIDILP